MTREKQREKALKILEAGTKKERMEELFADRDRKYFNKPDCMPLYTDEERNELFKRLMVTFTEEDYGTYLDIKEAIDRVRSEVVALDGAVTLIRDQASQAFVFCYHWADLEKLEGAVNMALMSNKDPKERTEAAKRIVKSLEDTSYCSYSCTKDGYIELQPDFERTKYLYTTNLTLNVSHYKAELEAIREYVKDKRLKLPGLKAYLQFIDDIVANRWRNWAKWVSGKEAEPVELYAQYKILPEYDQIEPSKERKIRAINYLYDE